MNNTTISMRPCAEFDARAHWPARYQTLANDWNWSDPGAPLVEIASVQPIVDHRRNVRSRASNLNFCRPAYAALEPFVSTT
jgi:hypothetical protein